MPLLYLREVEPFLPADPKMQMEESMLATSKKGKKSSPAIDREQQKRLSKRKTSLILSDAFVLILEIFQILALIQSMSLKWAYPKNWIKYTNFIFIFNADAWDFIKVQSGAYTQIQSMETPSSDVDVDYDHILIAWGIFLALLSFVFLSVFFILRHRQPPYLMVHLARLERAFLLTCQIIALPLGTISFRLFHCTQKKMSVSNSVECFGRLAWAYIAPAVIVILLLFVVVPIFMVIRIRKQKLLMTSRHHEDYLRLKEVEYMAGLDVIWAVHGYHLFSSFNRRAVYYKPIVHCLKLVLLIIFASADYEILNQAASLSVILSLIAILVIIIRPYRVTSFNVILSLSVGCLGGDCIFGAMIASVTPATVQSAWLVEPYSIYILAGINIILFLSIATWIIFMISRVLCCKKCFPNEPLWPVLTSYEYRVDGMDTYKFMAAVLRGRAVLDSCIRAPSIFAPVHQLSRQIQIINAFSREAEKTRDSLHATLLQLLDEMIDVFKRLEPVSLFAETVKEEIRWNAAKFVEIMPAFCHRLAQRDYDLILVSPLKKRVLLKMSIIGMFLNAKREKPVKDPVTQNALIKIWDEVPPVIEFQDEAEYREDLYPKPLFGPDQERMYMSDTINKPLELMELDDSDEEESLAVFLKRVPPILTMKDEESRFGSRSSLMVREIEEPAQSDQIPASTAATVEHQGTSQMPEVETIFAPNTTIMDGNDTLNDIHNNTESTTLLISPTSRDIEAPEPGIVNESFLNEEGEEKATEFKEQHDQGKEEKSDGRRVYQSAKSKRRQRSGIKLENPPTGDSTTD